MGTSCSLTCSDCCDVERVKQDDVPLAGLRHPEPMVFNLRIGVGMLYSPEQVREWLLKPMRDMVSRTENIRRTKDLLESGADLQQFFHTAWICDSCNWVYSRFYFRLQLGDKVFTPEYDCRRCRKGRLLPVECIFDEQDSFIGFTDLDGKPFTWRCPSCGGNRLEATGMKALWD